MSAKGLASSVQDAFDRWLAKGRPAYVEKERLDPLPAIALALQSGALPVLAHPLSLGLSPNELERTVGELADAGLVGLESIYGRYSREERASLAVMAAQAGLAITGGSDHHGSYKPDLRSVPVGETCTCPTVLWRRSATGFPPSRATSVPARLRKQLSWLGTAGAPGRQDRASRPGPPGSSQPTSWATTSRCSHRLRLFSRSR